MAGEDTLDRRAGWWLRLTFLPCPLCKLGICISGPSSAGAARKFKIHLFPIGEYIPWEGTFFHDLLKSLVLWESGLSERLWSARGVERKRFQLPENPGSTTRSIHYAVSVYNEIMYPEDSGIFFLRHTRGKTRRIDRQHLQQRIFPAKQGSPPSLH